MNVVNPIQEFLSQLTAYWSGSSATLWVLLAMGCVVAAYLLMLVSAFLGVERNSFVGSILTMLLWVTASVVLGGLTMSVLPDVYAGVGPLGWLGAMMLGVLMVVGAPVMQAIWNTGYVRSAVSLVVVVLVIGAVIVAVDLALHPGDATVARPILQMFQ